MSTHPLFMKRRMCRLSRRAECAVAIAAISASEALTRVAFRLYLRGFLDLRQVKIAFRATRFMKSYGMKIALRALRNIIEEDADVY